MPHVGSFFTGLWKTQQEIIFTNQPSIIIGNLSHKEHYLLTWIMYSATPEYLGLRFNNDMGANYNSFNHRHGEMSGELHDVLRSANDSKISLGYDCAENTGIVHIKSYLDTPTKVLVHGQSVGYEGATNWSGTEISGIYEGAAVLSSLTFYQAMDYNMSGKVILQRIMR